jgi:uncharacterized protein with HEPN domain
MLEEDRRAAEECLYAINGIQDYTKEISSIGDLINDRKTYDATLMNFIVLGESAGRFSKELKAHMAGIDWRAINGFRNFVAHEYFGLDENIVWSAILYHLPPLKQELEKILNAH